MNLRWIAVGLALLCFAQVWAKPADKTAEDSDYQEDDGQDERQSDYDDGNSGPLMALSLNETIFALPGQTVTLPCEFQNADIVAVEWRTGSNKELFMENTKMTNDIRINRLTNRSLMIDNVNVNDTGEYKCSAIVDPPIMILHKLFVQPEGRHVKVLPSDYNDIEQGESITLTCQVGGELKPRYMHWSREGEKLHSEESKSNGQVRAISLLVPNVTRHVAGDYQCVVEVGAENPIIKHLKLRVKHKPEIEYEKEFDGERYQHVNQYVTGVGADANITCVVHAHPGLNKLQWIHDNRVIKIDNIHYFKNDVVRSHHVLGIKNVTKADLGSYYCVAFNLRGESRGPEIRLTDGPGKPRFSGGQPVDDSIEFTWKVLSYSHITDAEFVYRKEGTGEDAWKRGNYKIMGGIGKESIIVTSLSGIEAGNYEAKVRASNIEISPAWGPYSDIKKFNGEYGKPEASTGKGAAAIAASSLMSLILIIAPLVYACL